MSGPHDEWLTLKERTEQARIDFIRTDLDACNTFVTVAETAYGMDHLEHAEAVRTKAENGYSDMLRHFSKAKGLTPEVESELQAALNQLRDRLDGVQRFRET